MGSHRSSASQWFPPRCWHQTACDDRHRGQVTVRSSDERLTTNRQTILYPYPHLTETNRAAIFICCVTLMWNPQLAKVKSTRRHRDKCHGSVYINNSHLRCSRTVATPLARRLGDLRKANFDKTDRFRPLQQQNKAYQHRLHSVAGPLNFWSDCAGSTTNAVLPEGLKHTKGLCCVVCCFAQGFPWTRSTTQEGRRLWDCVCTM